MPTRSELIYRAAVNIPSRFALVAAVARATRVVHLPRTRIGDTINRVLTLAGDGAENILALEPLGPVAIVEEDPYFVEMKAAGAS
jgi:hypothetical protein